MNQREWELFLIRTGFIMVSGLTLYRLWLLYGGNQNVTHPIRPLRQKSHGQTGEDGASAPVGAPGPRSEVKGVSTSGRGPGGADDERRKKELAVVAMAERLYRRKK